MGDVLTLADRVWSGEVSVDEVHPFFSFGDLVEVAEGVAFVPSFANVTAFDTGDGLVLVDTGSAMFADHIHRVIRDWTRTPLKVVIYTHGHIDHVFGSENFEREAERNGDPPVKVIAHEAVSRRFDRYIATAGYNSIINRRQFGVDDLEWPTSYRYPDVTYRDSLTFESGGEVFELRHGRGETDDHTWVWVPAKSVLCCGDFFIWACPNAGNPQKVQRYPDEWAAALEEMARLGAEVMLPGHGFPVVGRDRVRAALTDSAELLRALHDDALELINAGASLDELIHSVEPPRHLLARPYLQPIYDEPEFIVRNIWRRYAGWYDGEPAHLKPAPHARVAAEVAALAGGPERVARRALELAGAGDLRLAGHLVSWAAATSDDPEVIAAFESVYSQRAEAERSTMSTGIFRAAARGLSES